MTTIQSKGETLPRSSTKKGSSLLSSIKRKVRSSSTHKLSEEGATSHSTAFNSVHNDGLQEPLLKKETFTLDTEEPAEKKTEYEPPVENEDKSNSASNTVGLRKRTRTRKVLRRTPTTFWEDARKFKDGSVPHSIVVAATIGVVCGCFACLYYKVLEFMLDFFWTDLPEKIVVDVWPEWAYSLWIPLVGFFFATCLYLATVCIGEPGHLATTIKFCHSQGYLGMEYAFPMILASLSSILSGASLGPEAPLSGICASLAGWVSRSVFKQTNRNVIRKHTLMGLAGALAAFFGSPVGGSLFALEVQSRYGLEYFEHVIEAIFCGQITTSIYRGLLGIGIGPLWHITPEPVGPTTPIYVVIGAALGLFGAFLAYFFKAFHVRLMAFMERVGLLKEENFLWRTLFCATFFLIIGMFIPYTLFWSEDEIQMILTLAPAKDLPHLFPKTGLLGFELDTALKTFLMGFFKIIAISFSVAGEFRGGFIFPLFSVGSAFGRLVHFFFPTLPVPYACLCIASGLNVAITRTPVSTPLILSYLAGQQNTLPAVSMASLVSLMVTSYMPFIKTQIVRQDLDDIFYVEEEYEVEEENPEDENLV